MTKSQLGIISAIVAVALAGIIGYRVNFDSGGTPEPVAATLASEAPGFELKDSAGKTHRLSDFKGQAVVLHFWATWCPPCLDEIPLWLAAAKKHAGKKVAWVAVSLDKDWPTAHKILPDSLLPPGVVSVIDPKSEVTDRYGSYQFPETYLLTPELKIAAKWVGPQEWEGALVNGAIEKLTPK